MLFVSSAVLPGGLDKRALIHEPTLDSAFPPRPPKPPADLLWISTRAARATDAAIAVMRKVETSLFLKVCDSSRETVKKSLGVVASPTRFKHPGSSLPLAGGADEFKGAPFEGARCHPGLCLSLV